MRRDELVKILEKQTAAYFARRGFATAECGYILKRHSDWPNNIIVKEVADNVAAKKKQCEANKVPFSLHKYVHHGLSSQACQLNLLGTFVVNKDYGTLKELLSLSGIQLCGDIDRAEFEYTKRGMFNEREGQPTSVDLFIETNTNEHVITEFKFTEAGWGTCSVYEDGDCDGANPVNNLDSCYLNSVKQREYFNLMSKYDLLSSAECCPFTEFYQAYRLLLFTLDYAGSFLLIHDKRNPSFIYDHDGMARGKYNRFKKLLPPAITNRIFELNIQKIVDYLKSKDTYPWLAEFEEKYL